MKVAVIFVSLICSAAAFAPAFKPSAGTMALNAAMDGMSGSIDLRGKEFKFDPLNLSETYEPLLPFFREAELRHGRTAMLAVVGFIVPEFVRIPGDMYSFESIPKVVDVHDALLKNGPMYQLLMWIGLWEMVVAAPAINATLKGEREPGGKFKRDMRFGLVYYAAISHFFSPSRLWLDSIQAQG